MSPADEQERCDWCGRPGTIRQHDYWSDGVLVCRDPTTCDACELLREVPGDVWDAMEEAGLDYDRIQNLVEAELERRWREKVAAGLRSPQQSGETSGVIVNQVRRQLEGDEALDMLHEADLRGLLPVEASNLLHSMTEAGRPAPEIANEVEVLLRRLFPDA